MQESRTVRRVKLAETIERQRRTLAAMRLVAEKGPTEEIKKYSAERIRVLEQELARMESEYHELNVQQIRDELRGG
ncbi:MAG TPA: hypothetical protein VN682_22850 [Terriglobales bacterium]|jgi:hypothetical protein|nr:hypothetical protein [Terriglobales bacterium]